MSRATTTLNARLRIVVAVLSLALLGAIIVTYVHIRDGDRAVQQHAATRASEVERAHNLQSHHDFAGAAALLSQLLEREPQRHDARLMRAQILLHLQRPEDAMRDCTALMSQVDLATGVACVAQARAALGDVPRAYALITTVLERADAYDKPRDPALGWSASIAAELAERLGRADEAARWVRLAYRLDPDNHFIRDTYLQRRR